MVLASQVSQNYFYDILILNACDGPDSTFATARVDGRATRAPLGTAGNTECKPPEYPGRFKLPLLNTLRKIYDKNE